MNKQAGAVVEKVREVSPLIQCITNYVTIGDCANTLLAFGASPAMCEAQTEAYGFATISSAVYLNLGTLTQEQEMGAYQAVLGANKAGRPVVIDPAGCGAIPRKIAVMDHIARIGRISLIKGNMGEIKVLAGVDANVKGVDSSGEEEGIEEATAAAAKKYRCAVAATGRVDVISDGEKLIHIGNGVEMLTRITGAGCMLGALCAATHAVTQDSMLAAAAAIAVMGIAGETAYAAAKAPGSFRVALMDAIYSIDAQTLRERGDIRC